MSHRGQNPVNNTVQLWNGTRWVSFPNLNFQAAVLSTASSLWVESDASVGLTLGGANRRSLSPVYDGTGNPLIATKRIFAHRTGEGDGTEPQVIELPKIISGVSPVIITGPHSILLADILIAVTHSSGSVAIGSRYVAKWTVDSADPFPYVGQGVEALGNTLTPSLTLAAGVVGAGPPNEGAPTLTVNYSGFSPGDTMRYMLDITLALMGIVE